MILDTILCVTLPFVAIAVFVAATVDRSVYRPFTVSSMSSQLLERRKLYWGSIPFHWGIVLVLLGHLFALVMPGGIRLWNAAPVRMYLLQMTGAVLGVW